MNDERGVWRRLSGMMALSYGVQGAFWPILAVHLKDLGVGSRHRGWIFATMAIGSLLVPLGAGQLVDRLMATQRLLAVSYAIGAVFLGVLASGLVAEPGALFALFLAYWMIVAPSYGLCNALAMRHLKEPGRQFGGVRLWGTIGWMMIGWLVTAVLAWTHAASARQGAHEAFVIAAIVAVVMAGYSLTLPHTPPLARGGGSGASLREGLAIVRQPDVAVLLVTAFGVFLTTPMVYQVLPGYLESRGMPRAWIPTAMTMSQWPEILVLAALPWLLGRLGFKGTILLGIAAWFLRFLSLAFQPGLPIALAGFVLHGVGIGCFTVAGQLYVDRRAPSRQRASAQSLYLVLTSGLGTLLGNLLIGELGRAWPGDDRLLFIIPCLIDGSVLVYFLIGFRTPLQALDRTNASDLVPAPRPRSVRGTIPSMERLVTESADG